MTPLRIWPWLLFGSMAFAQNMNIRNYNVDHGLPQSQVMAIHQDPAGFLWVGTYSGVARYNGRKWVTFNRSNGLPGNHVTSFLSDKNGLLWLGTFGQGPARRVDDAFAGYDPITPLGSSLVNKIIQDQKGRQLFATDKGLFILKNGRLEQHFTDENGLPDTHCTDLYENADGLVYVATQSGLVTLLEDAVQELPFNEQFSNVMVHVVLEDRDKRLWVGTSGGLFYVEGDFVKRLDHPLFGQTDISCGTKTSDGGLWFGTSVNGVFKVVGTAVAQRLSRTNGLANNTINSIFFDEEHNLWIGSDSGVDKYRPGGFVALMERHGLPNPFARTLHLDNRRNLIWVGSRFGVYQVDMEFDVRPFKNPLTDGKRMYGVDAFADGRMAFFSEADMVVEQKDGGYKLFGENAGLRTRGIRCGLVDSKDRVWLGASGLYGFDNETLMFQRVSGALAEKRIYDMLEDDEGRLWLGSVSGLYRFDPETQEVYHPKGLTTAIWDLDLGVGNSIWVGTNGQGLWHLRGDQFTNFNSENSGLGNDFVWQVLRSSRGDVWVGHNQGIDRLREGEFTHFSKSDGLAHNEGAATAVLEDPRSRVWFGTSEGISIHMPGNDALPSTPPKVVVEMVQVIDDQGRARHVNPDDKLSHKEHDLNFIFAGLSFIKEEQIQFTYNLEGQDHNWSEPDTLAEVKYVNLAPTPYILKVKARNAGGPWSEETRFAFEVEPAFYQTGLFRGTAILLLIVLVSLYIRSRLQRVERRNRELEILVRQRTEALAQKGREFKELSLSDPLTRVRNRRFVAETMREEISRLKRRYFRYQKGDPFHCLGVVLMDLDHFKSVNDRYGHDVGDIILVETAERLRQAVRDSDVVARWGGEEFLILFREIQPEDLPAMALKLLEALRDEPFLITGDRQLQRTASVGFAHMHPALIQRDVPWEWALKMADLALYRAKDGGRDRAYGVDFNPDQSVEAWFQATREDPETSLKGEALTMVAL